MGKAVDESRFWTLIEAGFEKYPAEGVGPMTALLAQLSRSEAVSFQRCLHDALSRAYRWDLMAAACFAGCGHFSCGFLDFRAWLIAQGQATFHRVLADVRTLAELPFERSPPDEWILPHLPDLVFRAGHESLDQEPGLADRADPSEPFGDRIELTKKSVCERYPELVAHFGTQFMFGMQKAGECEGY